MDRYAVFVDAGYLYAAGSALLNGGQPSPRHELRLDCEAALRMLRENAETMTGLQDLLRIYWYDGALPAGLSTEQTTLGYSDGVKLRLGVVNGLGQQKGVDSRIVTDLTELARKRAITDAVLVSGDEDLRIGMEIAQEYGVRVHLLTVRDAHPSPLLRREADSTEEILLAEINACLTVHPPVAPAPALAATQAAGQAQGLDNASLVGVFLQPLDAGIRAALAGAIRVSGSVPREHDGRLLAQARDATGRPLDAQEKAALRQELRTQLGV